MELLLSFGQFRNSLQMVFLTQGAGWFSELPDHVLYICYNAIKFAIYFL